MKRILLFVFSIMIISSCNRVSTSITDLTSSSWKLVELNGVKDSSYAVAAFYTIDFTHEDSYFCIGVCNTLYGHFEIGEEGAISLVQKGMTAAICPENEVEQSLSKALANTDKFKIKKDQLYLYQNDKKIAIFRRFNKEEVEY